MAAIRVADLAIEARAADGKGADRAPAGHAHPGAPPSLVSTAEGAVPDLSGGRREGRVVHTAAAVAPACGAVRTAAVDALAGAVRATTEGPAAPDGHQPLAGTTRTGGEAGHQEAPSA